MKYWDDGRYPSPCSIHGGRGGTPCRICSTHPRHLVAGAASWEMYPQTGGKLSEPVLDYGQYRRLIEEMQRCYERAGELLAALNREFDQRDEVCNKPESAEAT